MRWNCFISHRAEDRTIAETLKAKIEALTGHSVQAYICEQNQGGREWRKEIEDYIINSNFMIFLYTVEEHSWRWCLYEIGMFNAKKEYERRDRLKQEREVKKGPSDDAVCEGVPAEYIENALLCFKNPHITKLLSPLADIQLYEPNKIEIKKFYKELICGTFTKGKSFRDICTEEKLHESVIETKIKFDKSRLVQDFYDKRITIDLNPPDKEFPVNIEDAIIEINQITAEILGSPPGNKTISWKLLFANFKSQSSWLEEIKESVVEIHNNRTPHRIMTPFRRKTESYIPVLSRVERLLPSEKGGEHAPTKLNVIFIPRSFAKKGTLSTSDLFIPICTVRMKWKKKSKPLEYLESDVDGPQVVVDANDLFLEMFNITGKLPDSNEEKPVTINELMERIGDYIVNKEKNIPKLYCDQTKIAKEIIYKCGHAEATVPLQFNEKHPSERFKNQCYLPSLISTEIRGDKNKEHLTFYMIAYLKYFWPLDHENNPYHENNRLYNNMREDCKSLNFSWSD